MTIDLVQTIFNFVSHHVNKLWIRYDKYVMLLKCHMAMTCIWFNEQTQTSTHEREKKLSNFIERYVGSGSTNNCAELSLKYSYRNVLNIFVWHKHTHTHEQNTAIGCLAKKLVMYIERYQHNMILLRFLFHLLRNKIYHGK